MNEAPHRHTVDASGKPLGRLSVEVARLLMGKDDERYQPNRVLKRKITVTNIREMNITDKKKRQNISYHHSGYPGGIKATSLGERFAKNPGRLLRETVKMMLPKNRLQKQYLKQLTIEEK